MKCVVVVPNWNGEAWLRDCIDSLLNQTLEHTLVVVENASVDNSSQILDSYGDKIIVLPQDHNLGFAGGVNAGIRYALDVDADFVALFNNDAVADKGWLEALVSSAETNPKTGIVAAKILHMDKIHLDSTGEFYTVYGLPFPRGRNQIDSGQFDTQVDIFGASGGASLYRIAVLRQIGLFDEDFFAYYEDVDISFRARLAGWGVHFEPSARAYHRMSATSSKISGFGTFQTAKNVPLLYIKNMPPLLFWKYLPFMLYWYFRMAAARVVRGSFGSFVRGWLWSIVLTPRKLIERRHIQSKRKLNTRQVNTLLYTHRPPKPARIEA